MPQIWLFEAHSPRGTHAAMLRTYSLVPLVPMIAFSCINKGPPNKVIDESYVQQNLLSAVPDGLLGPMVEFTKWRWRVDSTRQIGEMTRRAIKMAGTPPGGPVHIRYPLDILGTKNVTETVYPQSRFKVDANMQPDPALIEQSAKLLLEAKSPLLHVGAEVTRAHANKELVEFAELLGIPVAQGFSCYGDFPFRNPFFVAKCRKLNIEADQKAAFSRNNNNRALIG